MSEWNGHHAWDGHPHDFRFLPAVCRLCWCTRSSLGELNGWASLVHWGAASDAIHNYEAETIEPWLDQRDHVRPLTPAERERWQLLGSLPGQQERKRRERKRLSKVANAS